jgi:hypothetical protein
MYRHVMTGMAGAAMVPLHVRAVGQRRRPRSRRVTARESAVYFVLTLATMLSFVGLFVVFRALVVETRHPSIGFLETARITLGL